MINIKFLIYSLIFIIIIILIKLFEYKKALENKNIRLMQFYLDKKLINAVIINILKSQQLKQFNLDLIENIKKYFQLDHVVIMKYASLEQNNIMTDQFKAKLKNIISAHYQQLDTQSKDSHLILDFIEMNNSYYRLYIYFHLETTDYKNQENIICINKKTKYFSKDEISTLDTAVHLLRMFLVCDVEQEKEL